MAPSMVIRSNIEVREKKLRDSLDPMRGLTLENVEKILPLVTRKQAKVIKQYVGVLRRTHFGVTRKLKKEWLAKYLRDISKPKQSTQDYALGSGKKTVRGEIGNGVGVSVDTDADADDEDDDASTSIVPPAQPRVNVLR
ncbi:hypothetical protein KQX54_004674 [Cotesia glomerata]|uniref:Uncharacterized protein n=1 Tax=Cotesia glomerata TaxID=32391 RepID=A0AAV7J2L0_COTGL|nr:hypothetical protein KQX54_004674 [Cotesia glomerata]